MSKKLKFLALVLMGILLSINHAWGADPGATINFGTTDGYWAAHSTTPFTDSDSRSWARTYSAGGKSSGQAGYSQFGNSSNKCTSLVFTATAGKAMTLKTFSVSMAGASADTRGTIYLYHRTSAGVETQIGTASVSGTSSTTCSMVSNTTFTATDILKVSYVGTAKAIRVTTLSYSYTTGATKTFTLKIPVGDGTYSTLSSKAKSYLTEETALSAVSCGGGSIAGYYSGWREGSLETPAASPGTTYNSSTADGSLPSSGTTLYAVFSNDAGKYLTNPLCRTYTLSYDANGGSGAPSDQSGNAYNASVTVNSSVTPTRSNYIFLGWSTSSTATTKDDNYDPGDSFSITGDVVLYAVWCKDLSAGSASSVSVTSATYNTSTSKWDISVSWTSVTGATSYQLACRDDDTDPKTFPLPATNVGNVTTYNITGLTQGHQHTIAVNALNSCSNKSGGITYTPTCPELSSTTITYTLKTYNSFTVNWTTVAGADKYNVVVQKRKSDDSGWESTPAASFSNLTSLSQSVTGLEPGTKYRANVQAVANCGETKATAGASITTLNRYTITYYKNDGGATSATDNKTEGVSYTIASNTKFTRDGYTLSRWDTNSGGTGASYACGASYTTDAALTLYAIWTPRTYTVTLDKQSGSGGPTSVTATYDAAMPTPTTMPTRDDYNFRGYFGSTGGSGTQYYNSDGTSAHVWDVASNTTIYAYWTAKTYTNYRTSCGKTLYLDATYFNENNDRFGVYSWEDADASNNQMSDAYMTPVSDCRGHIYKIQIPADHDRVIFLHCSSGAAPASDWSNKDKQTVNLTPGANDFFTVSSGSGNSYNGSWGTYTQQVTVTYNINTSANGVSASPSSECVVKGTGHATQPTVATHNLGYSLAGWYENAEGTGSAWNFATGTFSDDKTLYAKWTAEPTTKIYLKTTFSDQDWQTANAAVFARFYVNGTSQAQNVLMVRNTCDPSILEADAPYGATHVSFARCASGTATLAEGNWDEMGVVYNYVAGLTMPSNLYFSITGWGSGKVSTGQAEGSAYVAPTYTISYGKGTGSGSAMASTTGIACGADQTISSNTYTPPSEMSFAGWYANVDVQVGGVTKTAGVDLIPNGATIQNVTGNITLTAQWAACTLYTVTLNVNGSAWKTVTQASCGASIDLSSYQGVPACSGGYTHVGWSETNSADPMFDAPTITKTSSYTPESDVTLYAVYSHAENIGTLVTSTSTLEESEYNSFIVVASGYNNAMVAPSSISNLGNGTSVYKSGNKCMVTGATSPLEIHFQKQTTTWLISKTGANGNFDYYYAQTKNPLGWFDEDDYWEWWYEDYIEKYGDWYDAESYVASNYTSANWSISIDGSTGVATMSASDGSSTRIWKYNISDVKFGAYSSGQKTIALYLYDAGTAYTTQPTMTVYSITKGVESGGTFNIAEGVACSGHAVDVTATPESGYAFSGWTSSSGGSFGNASSATTTFTPTANTTVTANFVAATPHDIVWMVNGVALSSGSQTSSLTAGTSFSTMTLPSAPANNTLSSACGAVANQFIGWSQTDMGFATGQSAPAKYFTNAAGAGTAYGLMGDADVTFYAVFAQGGNSNYMSRCPNTYTITLDDSGDYGGNGSATATEMSTSLTINSTPTRNGYSVEGYYKEVGTTTKVATDAGALQNGSGSGIDGWTNSGSQFIGTSDGTLFTNWSINTYNLTYENLNGASNSNPTTYQVTTATINLADPGSRTGYTFTGWTCGGAPITQITLGSTGDKTITANWSANTYAITYKDKDDAAYSGDKTDGRPTGLPAQHTYGSATELNDGTRTGYRFDGWYTSSNCSTGKVTSLGATDYTSAITLYAKWTASHTYSFSKNGVVDGTLQKGAVEGETVTMPNTTVDCGLWTTFVGWVEGDVAETTTEPATIYRAGDIYEVPLSSGDKTFKAVYSKHEGDASVYYEKETSGPKSGTYVIAADNTHMYIFAGYNANNASSTYGTNATDHTFSGSDNNIITSKGGGVEVSIIKNTSGKFAIKSGSYCAKPSSADLNTQETDASKALVWQLDGSGQIQEKDATTYFLQINTSNKQFKCYAGTQWPAYLYRKKVAGTTYYTTAPASCAMPTQITVSYNDNKSHAGDQTISGMPSGTTLTFTSYPDFASYTVGSAPTDPTGYHFVGWNTQADGNGDDYTAGSSVTTFGYRETITLYAKWERVYTVTLYDNGSLRTTLTQASAGANVTLPSGNNCTPGSAFTFVGWTDSPVQLNAEPVRPNIVSGAGEWGDDELTDDITLYSVYSKSVTGCDDFAAGVSGAYKMYYDGSKYATTAGGSGSYTGATSGTAEVFYIAYAPAHTGYTIRTSTGFVGWNHDGSELTKANATPYYWKISGSSSNWVITPEPSAYTKQLKSTDGSKFQLYATGTSGKLLLQKSAMTYYYNTAICGDNSITFHDGGGTISGTPTTPTGASWNSGTHILSGLEDCDKITTFPAASYDGWTFIGWSTEDYSNSGKHTADHAEENASTDEPDGSIIYKTGGNPYVVRGGSIDLYPIFTRFPDNEPFNTESGGDYYIYYLKPGTDDGYGANIRVYAGEYDGEKRYSQTTSCAAATEFTFTKDGDIWHIYDKTTSKYVAGLSGEDWLLHANNLSGTLDDWTLTIKSGNQFYASCQGGGRYITFSTSANYFMDYSTTANPGICLPVYLGTCTERIFSSVPNPTPTIDLTGDPYVTSSNGQTVRATATMTLSASHLASVPANKVIVSGGSGLKFATTASANPSETLSLSLTDGNLAATTIYVYYTPTATEDGLENIIVTAQAYNGSWSKDPKATGTVHCRHLPADFVIAAKWNNKWYALPSTCNSSGTSTTGVLITVDNDNDPTAATYAPSTTKWGLRQTKAGSRVDGSHNDRMVFTERITTATANNQQALYNYNGADVYTNATYTNYNNTNPERYEWIPVSSDFKDYTLTNAEANKPLILRNSDGEFKAQTTDQAYDGKVRLLPATFFDDNVQIVEWKTSSVVIMYTGTETTAKAKAGSNSETSAQTLSSQKLTHGIYEVTTGTALTGKTGENLILTFGSSAGKKIFEIPWIINGSANATSGHEKQDVVILNNGKLTAQSTKYSFRNIYVYGGGKLKIASGTSLGVNNIILRAGRISTNGTGGSATYNYDYPQVELGGTLTSTKTDIKYEYITDYDHWYHLCLPFDATLNSIHYPTEYYGQNVKEDNKGSWIIKRYDGATRATGNYAAWVDIESESATVASAGHGYIFWGAPKKISVGGAAKVRQQWGIQRMTMSVAAATATAAETANKTVDGLGSYASVPGNSGKVNDQGWNLIGNPYLMNLSGLNSTSLKTGKLIEEVIGGNKTGHWVSNNDGVRYVTVPDNHFDNYTAQTMAWFTSSNPMVAGRAFFVQIDGDATGVQFNTADRKSLMPALFAKVEESVDIETGIVMSDESKQDEVNFWIKDGKTEAYESNADYPKTPNGSNFNIYGVHETCDLSWIAISPEIAEGSMAIGYQVPTAGEYMLSLSETYVSDKIDHVLVTDHEVSPEITTDLMEGSYEFMVNQAETNKTRFTVSIVLKDEAQTPTDIDDVRGDPDKPTKFIYHDKIYILRGGQLYDATGKQVMEINK